MLILDATTKSLEIVLGGAVTANQLPVTASYVDITTSAFTPGSSDTASNSTTAVTIVAAPASSTQRQVKLLSIYNADTAAATVTVRLNDNSTLRTIVKITLQIGDCLSYLDGKGFTVMDASGNIKQSPTSFAALTVTGLTASQAVFTDGSKNLTSNAITGSGNVVMSTSPTLVTPVLGTPASGNLSNCTNLLPTGISGAGLLDLSNASAGQIKFPATQNPSANANTLDDYEEGTWTPVLKFGGGTTGIVYGTQSGIYTKIGNLVFASCRVVLTNKGSSTGSATIAGLPFAPSIGTAGNFYGFSFNSTFTMLISFDTSSVILLVKNTGSDAIDTDFTNTTTMNISAVYSI